MSTMIELGKRAVACKAWRWMPGMLVRSTNNYHRPARIEAIDGDGYGLTIIPDCDGPVFSAHHEYGIAGTFPRGCTIPDLDDPATVGCLLSLVREAWDDPGAYAMRYVRPAWDFAWLVCSGHHYHPNRQSHGDTEAEALVNALEAAND
jgi:hypothetical protein